MSLTEPGVHLSISAPLLVANETKGRERHGLGAHSMSKVPFSKSSATPAPDRRLPASSIEMASTRARRYDRDIVSHHANCTSDDAIAVEQGSK